MATFDSVLAILILVMTISLGICFIRLFIGPNVPNRTVAFDTISVHAVGIIVLFAVRDNAPSLLSVAMVTAVLGFLGTTILARYLERSAEEGWEYEHTERPFPSDHD